MYRLCQGCIFFRINLPRGGGMKNLKATFLFFLVLITQKLIDFPQISKNS